MIKLFAKLISTFLTTLPNNNSRYSTVAPFDKKDPLKVVNKHDLGLFVWCSYHELFKANHFYCKVTSQVKKNVVYLVTIVVRPTEETFVKPGNPVVFMFVEDDDVDHLCDNVVIPYLEACCTKYNWENNEDFFDIQLSFEPVRNWEACAKQQVNTVI